MIIWIAPVLLWLSGKAQDYVDFLRSIPSLLAPKPNPLSSPYTPPFTDGQCIGVLYGWKQEYVVTLADGTRQVTRDTTSQYEALGALLGVRVEYYNQSGNFKRARTIVDRTGGIYIMSDFPILTTSTVSASIFDVIRLNGVGSCGNLPNPNAPPSIADDGLFNPSNPLIADDNGVVNPAAIVLAPAFPLALIAAILAGYQAAMQAAQAALAALDAIKKIAEGLESLKDLWEKLRNFLNEWEKNRPKKRDTVRQTYGRLVGDGALDFFPSSNQQYQSIQLDIVITTIPIGFGKFFGSFSPHRYRYKELGYIAFYSTTQGILEVHSVQFKRTSLQIPKLAVGFIYHLGLDEQIEGHAFGTFSIEKS